MKELKLIFKDYNLDYIANNSIGAIMFMNATITSLIAMIVWKLDPVVDSAFIVVVITSFVSLATHLGVYLSKTKINHANATLVCLFEYIMMLGIEMGLFNFLLEVIK